MITPDLLMIDDVRINGVPCVDRRQTFLWSRSEVSRKKTQKQVDRYVAEYGHGGHCVQAWIL